MLIFLCWVVYILVGLVSFGYAFSDFSSGVDTYIKMFNALLKSILAGIFWPAAALFAFIASY